MLIQKFLKLSLPLVLLAGGFVSTASSTVAQTTKALPRIVTVKSMEQGDLMCYLTVVEAKVERSVGATFEICEQKKQFLNKKVRLSYQLRNVDDCQSIGPCGKTRKEWLVVRMARIK
ncbi:hypothetical protein Cri9333_0954 [Crinalium epipsammum PCC 9333]|uniref:Uncharacterized protein n=1 Tax=Crinalium epipsammum PCC 9333 TaxID=1173022 RepID=K9VWD1_9CYAN|nr:hypothetical protein [Crinalium epipsammum]AFZ11869.1 hypothetical protein Cri9333_0954 [Crinalium epipsammum PCC 9333]